MCGTCGCSDTSNGVIMRQPGKPADTIPTAHDHLHIHGHDGHSHGHDGHSHGHDGHSHGHEGHSHGHGGHSHGHEGHSHKHDDHSHEQDHRSHGHDRHSHRHDSHSHPPRPGEHIHDHHGRGVGVSHTHPSRANTREIQLEQDILAQNNLLAERNRGFLEARNITALNLISSPGAGKTTLLEKTILSLKQEVSFFVIEGDQQTMNDAERIDATGVPVIQINTGSGCHLDAAMVHAAIKKLNPDPSSLLFIENVGNLVCPALFDLGEALRIVIISVTEGDDKPIKYPTVFHRADVCIINKTDLLPYVNFDMEKSKDYARQVNPGLRFFEVSANTGDGMQEWLDWLKSCATDN